MDATSHVRVLRAVLDHAGCLGIVPRGIGGEYVPADVAIPNPEKFAEIVSCLKPADQFQVRFLAYTGARTGEAERVTWADVDFDRGTVRIPTSKLRLGSPRPTHRLVPMNAQLRSMLQDAPKWAPADYVIQTIRSRLGRALRLACEQSETKPLRPHDLRKLFATRCRQAGVRLEDAQDLLGHARGSRTLLRVYAQPDLAEQITAVQRIRF